MTADGTRGSLLVVDDEVELMLALCDALAEAGFRVAGVTSPDEALDLVRRGGVDVVLTDLLMPGTDGVRLLRAAEAIDPAVVGVVMTGVGQGPEAAAWAGAHGCVFKPFRLGQVTRILDGAVAAHRQRSTGGSTTRR